MKAFCLFLLFSALLIINNIGSATAYVECDCFCAEGCKPQTNWISFGRSQICTCECVCPPLPWPWSSTPNPPTTHQPPPPAHQTPRPPPPPAHHHHRGSPPSHNDNPSKQPLVDKCNSVANNVWGCSVVMAEAIVFSNVDLGQSCCHAIRTLRTDCPYNGLLPLAYMVDLDQHCSKHH